MVDESAAEKVRAYRPRHAHQKRGQHEEEQEEDCALADEALAHMNLSKDTDEYVERERDVYVLNT